MAVHDACIDETCTCSGAFLTAYPIQACLQLRHIKNRQTRKLCAAVHCYRDAALAAGDFCWILWPGSQTQRARLVAKHRVTLSAMPAHTGMTHAL